MWRGKVGCVLNITEDYNCTGYVTIRYSKSEANHSISFVNPDTGDHTNTIEGTWRDVKAFLRPYNRQEDYEYHLAHYMFAARCKAQGISPFCQFLAIVADIEWKKQKTSYLNCLKSSNEFCDRNGLRNCRAVGKKR